MCAFHSHGCLSVSQLITEASQISHACLHMACSSLCLVLGMLFVALAVSVFLFLVVTRKVVRSLCKLLVWSGYAAVAGALVAGAVFGLHTLGLVIVVIG